MGFDKTPADAVRGQDWNETTHPVKATPEGAVEVSQERVIEVLEAIVVEQRRTNAFLSELLGGEIITEGDVSDETIR